LHGGDGADELFGGTGADQPHGGRKRCDRKIEGKYMLTGEHMALYSSLPFRRNQDEYAVLFSSHLLASPRISSHLLASPRISSHLSNLFPASVIEGAGSHE
jgi:hypothetical protein